MNIPVKGLKTAAVILGLAATVAACGGDTNKAANTEEQQNASSNKGAPTAEETKIDNSSNPDYKAGIALIEQSDCVGCHQESQKLVGPSYKEIADKYPMGDATVDMLAKKIIAGGTGVWGDAQMTPHPQLSEDDAKKMVKYIMLLKS